MSKNVARTVFALLAVVYVLTHFLGHALAQSSLGIGTNEAVLPSTGFFAGLLNWINSQQQSFYRALTGALKEMRQDGSRLWFLVGLSFLYGVFHAAGPGHGKAVISSYMLANEVALRRGVMLSFVSAMLQGLTAVAVMLLVYFVLRGTSISMTKATWTLETASYALIAAFGAWLLWQKGARRLVARLTGSAAHNLSSAAVAHAGHGHGDRQPVSHGHSHDHACDHHDHHHRDHHQHAFVHEHGPDMVCETCGHSHAPDPAMLAGDRFDWRTAWSAVAAVGVRPCSGALIVLTFAFLNGLWLGGILSVFAMSLGTAITVAALATMAVTAKNWAVAFAGDGRTGNAVHTTIEIGGAALVMVLGLMLLAASLAA